MEYNLDSSAQARSSAPGASQSDRNYTAKTHIPESSLRSAAEQSPPPAAHTVTPINLAFNLSEGSASSSSLLDAVVGKEHIKSVAPTENAIRNQTTASNVPPDHHSHPYHSLPSIDTSNASKGTKSSYPKVGSQNMSSEWEVLSDAGSRLNEGVRDADEEEVQKLQEKVEKRRSKYKYLEDELAALNAQLEAADQRLARVKSAELGNSIQSEGKTSQ